MTPDLWKRYPNCYEAVDRLSDMLGIQSAAQHFASRDQLLTELSRLWKLALECGMDLDPLWHELAFVTPKRPGELTEQKP